MPVSPNIKFKTFEDGIQFYMLVNQFKRVADKIEKAHDMKLNVNCNMAEFDETIKYYQLEKSIILKKMKDLFDFHSEPVSEGK